MSALKDVSIKGKLFATYEECAQYASKCTGSVILKMADEGLGSFLTFPHHLTAAIGYVVIPLNE